MHTFSLSSSMIVESVGLIVCCIVDICNNCENWVVRTFDALIE